MAKITMKQSELDALVRKMTMKIMREQAENFAATETDTEELPTADGGEVEATETEEFDMDDLGGAEGAEGAEGGEMEVEETEELPPMETPEEVAAALDGVSAVVAAASEVVAGLVGGSDSEAAATDPAAMEMAEALRHVRKAKSLLESRNRKADARKTLATVARAVRK